MKVRICTTIVISRGIYTPLSKETVDKQKKKITLLTLEVCLITPFYRTESRLTEC